jgi:hypothetical protein
MSDWQTIDTAPKDGTRVRVGHNLDASSMKPESPFKTTGRFDEVTQNWHCSAAFVCLDQRLRWQPTHWLPEDSNSSTQSN